MGIFFRFLWIALFTAGFGTATFFILRMWIKWQSSPVLISVESTDFPNALLPFPTVSICNVNQVIKFTCLVNKEALTDLLFPLKC